MCGLFLCEIIKGFHHYARILIFLSCFGIYSDFSYFFSQFFWLLGWIWELFWEFLQFQLLFSQFFQLLGWSLGCCFKRFRDYSSPRYAYYTINQWNIDSGVCTNGKEIPCIGLWESAIKRKRYYTTVLYMVIRICFSINRFYICRWRSFSYIPFWLEGYLCQHESRQWAGNCYAI